MRSGFGMLVAGAAALILGLGAASQAAAPGEGPRYTADGRLEFPKAYRTWVYLSTGMDMSYVDKGGDPDMHMLDNVFVNRDAYDAFQRTGHWPDKTVMILEARRAIQKGSINKRGHFQADVMAREVHVKDDARFKATGGWAFFGFDGAGEAPAKLIPANAGCISCHEDHGAVDTTFVQFYPTLLPLAREKQTLSANYLKAEAAN